MAQIEGRKVNVSELIERYIESMNNFCSKNAELKKLKD
jgi:predicted DNA-binding protein